MNLLTALNEWYAGELGQQLWQAEQAHLNEILPQLFGYHIVHCSIIPRYYDLSKSPIHHQIYLLDQSKLQESHTAGACVDYYQLPFASNSVDVVVLPHVLEFLHEPHVVLREASRIVIPEGHIIIIGFNPHSLWGLWRWLKNSNEQAPWGGSFIPPYKIHNWLMAYDFNEMQRKTFFYTIPNAQTPTASIRQRMFDTINERLRSHWGAAYIYQAQKKVSALTPLRPVWRRNSKVAANGIVQPTHRVCWL